MKDDRLVEMRIFKAVAETGGFTSAAHLLCISQPVVSQSINNLENRLGVKLLHRSTRIQRLTTEGEAFLVSCTRIIEEIDNVEAQIKSNEAEGDLRVSAPLAFGMDQIVPTIPAFMNAHPKIRLHLSLSDTRENLLEGKFDVLVRMGRLEDSSLVSRRLCGLQRLVVASPKYVEAHGIPTTPEELSRHNCLLWSGSQENLNLWPFLVHGELRKFNVHGNFRSSNGMTLFQLCQAGVGVMRLAEHLALPAIRQKQLVHLLAPYIAQDDTAIHALYLSERHLVPRIRVFIKYLEDRFAQPPWQKEHESAYQ